MPDIEEIKQQEAAKVIALREELGMSRAEFSGALGIGSSTLRNVENARFRMGARTMARAEKLLEQRRYPKGPSPVASVAELSPAPARTLPDCTVSTELIDTILAYANSPDVAEAAPSLAKALGCTEQEALTRIIAAKLQP